MSAKIFLIGLPKSCRTSLAEALGNRFGWEDIHATNWIEKEFDQQYFGDYKNYDDAYQAYLNWELKQNPCCISDPIKNKSLDTTYSLVVDGLYSPKDFSDLFDYRTDTVIFLNRQDYDNSNVKDCESIGISVIRDYCFWLSSANLLDRKQWLEYNFRISDPDFRDPNKPPLQKPKPKVDDQFVKEMGARNSIFIVRSMDRVISHAIEKLRTQ